MREKGLEITFDRGKMLIRKPHAVCPLTYLKIRLRNNAKTCSSPRYYFIYWRYSHPFWRYLSATVLLQTIKITQAITSPSSVSSTQQSIHNRRGDVSTNLSNLFGARTNRDKPSLKTQRCFPIPHGLTHLSQSNHLKTLPSSDGSLSTPKVEEPPRQTSIVNDPKTRTSHQSDLRSGFHCPYPLRQTGDGSDRLQSQKVGPSLLSPPSLFQWDHQGFLAWRTPPWRYPYGYRDRGTSEGSLCQIASLCKDRNYPSRQGFLRSRDHRISGVQESLFCHCGQAYCSGQENNLNSILSNPFFWSGDGGVYISTHKVEKRVSLCGGKASHPRRPFRATHPLLNGQIQLSGYYNQHEIDPSPYMEILQWPSRRRTDYQRTQRGLPFRENSHKIFCSQRALLPYSFILLQSHQLVQAPLLANGVS